MKLAEYTLYAVILFLGVYTLGALLLRYLMESTETAHMIAGIAASVLSIGLFIFLLLKNSNK